MDQKAELPLAVAIALTMAEQAGCKISHDQVFNRVVNVYSRDPETAIDEETAKVLLSAGFYRVQGCACKYYRWVDTDGLVTQID